LEHRRRSSGVPCPPSRIPTGPVATTGLPDGLPVGEPYSLGWCRWRLDTGVACSLSGFGAEPIELRPAADDGVLLGVEGTGPQPGSPARFPLGVSPGPASGLLVGPAAGHTAAAWPAMAASGCATVLSQSCTTQGRRPRQRMFCDSESPWPITKGSASSARRARTAPQGGRASQARDAG
jgi:hypothetical protein